MKIYNQAKTEAMETYDPDRGYLREDVRIIVHHDAVPERVHKTTMQAAEELIEAGENVTRADGKFFRVVKEYPNGGRDVEEIKAVVAPAEEAWDETEKILVYIPYTELELAEREIAMLKERLAATDYLAIKYAEGELSEDEYAVSKENRRAWRARINALEEKIREVDV